jgi:phosphoglucomutase
VNIIAEVQKVKAEDNPFSGNSELIEIIGEEIDKKFLKKSNLFLLVLNFIKKHKDLKIVYTPIHGTGVKLIPAALKTFGFENLFMYLNRTS